MVCTDMNGLLKRLDIQTYASEDWKLFVDSSRRSLKVCIFTQWKSVRALVPLAHSTTMKEKYEETKVVLENISYYEHNLVIYVDIKMVIFFLGEQSGYTCGIVETK